MKHTKSSLKEDEKSPQERSRISHVSPHGHSLSPFMYIQQSIGNAALKQLLDSQGIDLININQTHHAVTPQLLEFISLMESEETLVGQFSALTKGQQQAFWQQIIAEGSLTQPLNMHLMEQAMDKLSHIELEPNEPLQEGNLADYGSKLPPYTSVYQGLLSPYRALWHWLNYKGNKQGQQHLLRKLDTLSLPGKQLFLHRLVGGTKLSTESLASTLTIKQNEQLWVDWARIEQLLNQLSMLNPEVVKQQLALVENADTAEVRSAEARDSDDHEQLEDADDLFWLTWLSDAASNKEQAPKNEFSALYDPEQLSMLLLGVPLSSREQATPTHGDKLVGRFLNIEASKPDMMKKLIEKRSKELGYSNVNALLQAILLILVEQLEEHARKRKDERYVTLLQRLMLTKGNTIPSKPELHQALHKLLIQK